MKESTNTIPSKSDDTTGTNKSSGGGSGSGGGWGKSFMNVIQKKCDSIAASNDAKAAGKLWNPTTKQYEFYFLDVEETQLESEIQKQQEQILQQQQGSTTNGDTTTTTTPSTAVVVVVDTEYYDLLQISTNADANMIKKAYYREARNCHPDKHLNDPKAHEKFTLLGHAYQILSDPKKREYYDKHGKSSDTSNNASDMMQDAIDPSVFFNVMFGSSLVEPYIGELWLSSQTDSMMKDMSHQPGTETETEVTDEEMMIKMEMIRKRNDLKQKLRQVTCAKNLRDRISTYTKETREAFIQGCKDEAIKICAGSFGDLYCMTIGFALQVAAEEYIGFETSFFGLGGHVARTKKNASGFASNIKLLSAGVKAVGAGSKVMREAEDLQKKSAIAKETTRTTTSSMNATNGGNTDNNPGKAEEEEEEASEIKEEDAQQMMASLEGSVPAFLEFAWAVNKRDIQSTLRHVCKKLLDDASVPKIDRLQRAEAVRIIGTVFQKVGKHHQSTTKLRSSKDELKKDNAIARVKVATMATMAKAQGQEVTEEDQEIMLEQVRMANVTTTGTTTASSTSPDDTKTASKKAAK